MRTYPAADRLYARSVLNTKSAAAAAVAAYGAIYTVSKNHFNFYILNKLTCNLAKNIPFLIIFGVQNPWEISHQFTACQNLCRRRTVVTLSNTRFYYRTKAACEILSAKK